MASLPHTIWHLYLDVLVNYEPGSFVAKTASTCRILAFAIILPFVILTLLDVASYVIARTLGIIDATKASTGGEHLHTPTAAPTIVVQDSDACTSDPDTSGDPATCVAASTPLPPDGRDDFGGGDADDLSAGTLRLAGVDTFSPAPSQPGSPTLSRREFALGPHPHPYLQLSPLDDGARAGREGPADAGAEARAQRETSSNSSESELSSSYAFVDRDSGAEDAGLLLRRRTRQPGTGPGGGTGDEEEEEA